MRQHLRLGVVDQKHIDQLQCFGQLFRRTVDPVIHGVAPGEANLIHVAADISLQSRLNIREEQEICICIFLWDARLEGLENVKVGVVSFGFVEIVHVRSTPAKGLAVSPLQTANVDTVLLENSFLLRAKVLADYADDAHFCEVTRGQREIRGGASKDVLYGAGG